MYPLFKIDPERIVIPSLHCEIKLLNKFNEWFQDWVLLWVKELPEELEVIRRAYIDAMATEKGCGTELNNQTAATPLVKKALKDAVEKALKNTTKAREAASKKYDGMVKEYGKREGGFLDLQERYFIPLE